MGIADRFYGRGAKARDRRAAKIRAKYAEFPGMTSQLLEVLARAVDVPSKNQVRLYLEAVPSGTVPRRELHGFRLSSSTTYVGVLFDDALSVRWAELEGFRDKEMAVQGAELPFWGMQKVDVFSHEGDDGILVSGNDGSNDYRIGFLGFDPQDVQAFADELEAARQRYAQRADHAPATPSPGAGSAQMKVNIDSSLPPEQQLAALEQMRVVGAVPDEVYRETAARIRGTAG